MNTARRWLAIGALASGVLLGTTGCEQCEVPADEGDTRETKQGFCSVERFDAEKARTLSEPVESGATVEIRSINGKVTVEEGDSNEVFAGIRPFVHRAFNTSDSEIQQNFKQLKTKVEDDGSGGVIISTSRADGAPSTLGANMTVKLPSDFDGALIVDQNNGAVEVDFAGSATEVQIDSENGSVDAVTGSASFVNIVNDTGDIDVVSSSISEYSVRSEGLGDVTVSIGEILDGAVGGSITAEKGSVDLRLPSDGVFTMPATATNLVDLGSVPGTCIGEESAENSKRLTCNEGAAEFSVSADGSNGEVTVSYD